MITRNGLCNISHPASGGPCPRPVTWRILMEIDTDDKGWVGFCEKHASPNNGYVGEVRRERITVELAEDTEAEAWDE